MIFQVQMAIWNRESQGQQIVTGTTSLFQADTKQIASNSVANIPYANSRFISLQLGLVSCAEEAHCLFPIWLSCSVLCKNFGSFQFHRLDCCSPKPTPLLAFFEYLLLLIRENSKGSKSIAPSFSNLLLHKDHSIVSAHSLWRLQKQNLQQPEHYREYRNYQVKFLSLFCLAKDCIL